MEPEPPDYIKDLFRNKHFLDNIRAYNQMFSMTSFGARVDESVNAAGTGPYVFMISGQIFHWIGTLCPTEGEPPRFLQLYIYDTENERVGAIVFESGPKTQTDYDVIIEMKDGRPKRINKLHPSYMSLQFPLIFIYGQSGYQYSMKLINSHGSESEKIRSLTMNMYYAHQLHDRFNLYGLLARGGRLFQQYVVGAYCSIELSRMDYIRCKQGDIRNEYLSGLHDAITRGDHDGSDVGTRIILPASFTGGPRYMYSHYLDALAICRVHGNPKFFITFTCNVKWPEIKRYMSKFPELSPADRADIVDRIFQMKVRAFISLLKNDKPFGHVTAVLYTIEFQNRGFPHCHTLLWVTPNTKIQAGEDVDQYITAELPDPKLDPHGYKVVSEMMMHGPCGPTNSGAACMQEGFCSKSFPKKYNEKTFFDKDGYVHYQRRNTGIYCIRREFISKGTDRVVSCITRPVGDPSPSTGQRKIEAVDEIQKFVNARYIGPYEACWRIFNFRIHHREPAVVIMAVHIENMQQINFRSGQRLEAIVGDCERKKTTLTEWLNFNTSSEEGRHLTYLNFPSEFVWCLAQKSWKKRANKNKPSIGRLTYVHPSSGELFYLRMLLCHQKGCKSFQDIQKVDDKVYPTYRAACKTLGLLGDDKEWSAALEEAAAHSGTSAELRSLFAHILIFSEVTDPITLWKKHWTQMAEDIPRRISTSPYIDISHVELEGYVLYQMEALLSSCAKSLKDFGLPSPPRHLLDKLANELLVEERNYDRDILTGERYALVSKLNKEQKEIYDLIINASTNNLQELIFVNGHGGTGKTFLWKSIISSLRSQGKIARQHTLDSRYLLI
uniref:uncharacterized protein LOC122583571 n=1 Tax=Erigeron canadensis TaxID=72917 RepID=UPI001CB9A017|nr:uncharacterized protein LOC122583571 [Erigeron canadensis]